MCCCTQLLPSSGGHPAAVGCSAWGWGPHWHWDLQGHRWFGGATGPCQRLVSVGTRDARLPGLESSGVPAPSAGPAPPAPTWIMWEQLQRRLWEAVVFGVVVLQPGTHQFGGSAVRLCLSTARSIPPCAARCVWDPETAGRASPAGASHYLVLKGTEGLSPRMLLGAAMPAPLGFSHGTARGEEPWGAASARAGDEAAPGEHPVSVAGLLAAENKRLHSGGGRSQSSLKSFCAVVGQPGGSWGL